MIFSSLVVPFVLGSTCFQEPAPATPPTAPAAVKAESGRIRIDKNGIGLPAGKIRLRDLIEETAKFMKWNVMISPTELEMSPDGSEVALQTPISLDATNAEDLLSELVYAKGLVLLLRDSNKGMYEVVSLHGPRAREVATSAPHRTPEEILARPNLKMSVTTVLPLKLTNAPTACNTLRPFFATPGGAGLTVGTSATGNALLLAGIQSQVADAIRMVQKIDAEAPRSAAAAAAAGLPAPAAAAPALTERITALEKAVQVLTEQVTALQKQLADKR